MRGSAAACGSARTTPAAERQGRSGASKKRVIPILTIVAVGFLAACFAPAATAQAQFEPARLNMGSPPAPPPPTVVRSRSGFDIAAVNAARRWRFRPATRDGQPVRSVAYLVFGFREPVVVLPVPTVTPAER